MTCTVHVQCMYMQANRTSFQIEMKLLESAENLFVASQSEARNEKMNKAIATHKSNIALLHEAIVEAKGKYVLCE